MPKSSSRPPIIGLTPVSVVRHPSQLEETTLLYGIMNVPGLKHMHASNSSRALRCLVRKPSAFFTLLDAALAAGESLLTGT